MGGRKMSGITQSPKTEGRESSESSSSTSPVTEVTRGRKPTELKCVRELRHFINYNAERLTIVLVIKECAENSAATYNVVVGLANKAEFKVVAFAEVVSEEHPDICDKLKIVKVPSVLIYRRGLEIDRVVGEQLEEVATKMKFFLKHRSDVYYRSLDTNLTTSPEA